MKEITHDNHLHSGRSRSPCPLYEITKRALPCPWTRRWPITEGAQALESGLPKVSSSYVLRIECPWADFLKFLAQCQFFFFFCLSLKVDMRLNWNICKERSTVHGTGSPGWKLPSSHFLSSHHPFPFDSIYPKLLKKIMKIIENQENMNRWDADAM